MCFIASPQRDITFVGEAVGMSEYVDLDWILLPFIILSICKYKIYDIFLSFSVKNVNTISNNLYLLCVRNSSM